LADRTERFNIFELTESVNAECKKRMLFREEEFDFKP